jgi:hypothetical protein
MVHPTEALERVAEGTLSAAVNPPQNLSCVTISSLAMVLTGSF